MNIFDDMDEAVIIVSQRFGDEYVWMGLSFSVNNGKYEPQYVANAYRTNQTITGKGSSFVQAANNLVAAVTAHEAAILAQSPVVTVKRNVLQLQAPVADKDDGFISGVIEL